MHHTGWYPRAVKTASFVLVLLLAALPAAEAATVEVTLRDGNGAALEEAVVWVMRRGGQAPARRRDAAIEQRDKQFIPRVSVVQVGTAVSFPNRDSIRHHVYSFSPARIFEIKLYAGTPAAPVVFDKPGEVVLGCNIHDNMIAYVYVVETPWFAKSDRAGVARIDNLPPGDYEVHARHFAQAAAAPPQAATLAGDKPHAATFAIPLKAAAARPPPS